MKQLLLLALNLLLAGPTLAQNNVWYGAEANADGGVVGQRTTRLYLDTEGSLYPEAPAALLINHARFTKCKGLLRSYYQGTSQNAGLPNAYFLLRSYYGLPDAPTRPDFEEWRKLQGAMQDRFIRQFTDSLCRPANQPDILVVLLHGFNNAVDEVQWYSTLQSYISNHYFQGKNVHFLEVRWDGRTANGPKSLFRIWGAVQHSIHPVGLTLRRILRGVGDARPKLPVFVMAHSTGAPIACAALWNSQAGVAAQDTYLWGRPYNELIHTPTYATPRLAGAHILLLAPAMNAAHFQTYLSRTAKSASEPAPAHPGVYGRIVVGQNAHDIATSKGGMPMRYYDTSLGCRTAEFCRDIPRQVSQAGSQSQAYLVDFTAYLSSKPKALRTTHGVTGFMSDKQDFKTLLDAWLLESSPTNTTSCAAPPRP